MNAQNDKTVGKDIAEAMTFAFAYEDLESTLKKWIDTQLPTDWSNKVDGVISIGCYRDHGDPKDPHPGKQTYQVWIELVTVSGATFVSSGFTIEHTTRAEALTEMAGALREDMENECEFIRTFPYEEMKKILG